MDGFIERTKIKVEVDVEPNLGRLDRDLEIALFRVIQQTLASVGRRIADPKVRIRIGTSPSGVFVEVACPKEMAMFPGRFTASRDSSSGSGILMIRERIRRIGGVFETLLVSGDMVTRVGVASEGFGRTRLRLV